MNKLLHYKNYTGSIKYSKEYQMYYGEVLNIQGLIAYEGRTLEELEEDFKDAIDDTLIVCEAEGIEPPKPNIRYNN